MISEGSCGTEDWHKSFMFIFAITKFYILKYITIENGYFKL